MYTVFFEQIQNISRSDTFALRWDFNVADTGWKGSTVGCNPPTFLKGRRDNFMTQALDVVPAARYKKT